GYRLTICSNGIVYAPSPFAFFASLPCSAFANPISPHLPYLVRVDCARRLGSVRLSSSTTTASANSAWRPACVLSQEELSLCTPFSLFVLVDGKGVELK